jgi:tetratricopeptide (TPR) repeat protein
MVLLFPALETWQHYALRVQPITQRVETLLAERRVDPAVLREFAELEPQMDDSWTYHLVLGELFRLHGELLDALLQFQKAVLAQPADPDPFIFLGNMSLEEGDLARAIQHYDSAIELDPRNALAYYNLSFAYDQDRRFHEGDAAREEARKLAGRQVEEMGLAGRIPRIRYPRIGRAEIDRMMSRVPPETRIAGALTVSTPAFGRYLLGPMPVAFWVTFVIGVVVLVLRGRLMWRSSVCVRCGKVFCERCKTSTESASYCTQCISVFLKRDMVSIEQQSLKQLQIRRWDLCVALVRRLAAVTLPGSPWIVDGRLWRGVALGFCVWLMLLGALLWAPKFLPSIEPLASPVPVQVVLVLVAAVAWVRAAAGGWSRR